MASLDELPKRQDPVPDGVEQEVGFFAGGDDDECNDLQPHEPLDVWVAGQAHDPWHTDHLHPGHAGEVQVTLVTPTGHTFTTIEPPLEGAGFHAIPLPLPPGSKAGTCKIYVTRAGSRRRPGSRGNRSATPGCGCTRRPVSRAPPCSSTWAASRPADLHLYMCADTGQKRLSYCTTRTVTVDASGAALLLLETSARSTPTCYALVNTRIFAPRELGQGLPPVFADFKLVQ